MNLLNFFKNEKIRNLVSQKPQKCRLFDTIGMSDQEDYSFKNEHLERGTHNEISYGKRYNR